MNRIQKIGLLLFSMLISLNYVFAQDPAIRSVLIGIGQTACASGNSRLGHFGYIESQNRLDTVGICEPKLGSPGFNISGALVDYNPKDNMVYYLRWSGSNTYVWRWPVGTCPADNPAPLRIFNNAQLTVAFDKEGYGWMVNMISQSTNPATFKLTLQRIDFTTGVLGPVQDVALPSGVKIYTANGDFTITPAGQFYFAFDNKLMTMNYTDYGVSSIQATYIDTIPLPNPRQNLIGLAYVAGQMVASFKRNASNNPKYTAMCSHNKVDMMTGERTDFSKVTPFSSFDNTSVTSGIGAAKKLVSVTNLGNGQHEVVYDVRVENFGNYPLSNVQVYDTLSNINGAGNVVSASAVLVSNPAGVALNSAYNGTNVTSLLAANQTLKNYPEGENNFTIRITVRLTNIVPGKIYYNSATATATGFGGNNKNLRDVSTDGSRPDLNLNGKPDDAGESVPTPFVVVVAGESPPCPVINKIIYSENFGTGSSTTTMPNGATTGYTGSTTAPLATERYMITSNPSNGNSNYWHSMSDHTGNANGRMMVVNADVQQGVIFSKTINNLCSNLKYSLNVWVANISNSNQMNFCNAVGGYKLPKLQFRVRDASSGLVLTHLTTPEITGSNWQQHGIRFVMPSGYSSIILEVINQGEGGCGNDLALDDIEFGLCDADPVVNTTAVSAGCIGGSATFSASLNDPTIIDGTVQYQWQSSTDSINYTNINGATQSTYTIPSMAATHQRYYRVLVASGGNINNASCRYASPGFYLALKSLSTAPTSIQVTRQDLCPGTPIQLTAQGGTLGTNARYVWYAAGTCGEGTPIGTGKTINITTMVNRTYYVRIEGDCNATSCVSAYVPVGCDIDDDDDGIPDLVENHGIDDAMDTDNDGIPDYRDPDTPGFIDVNNDGIDDRVDADLDGIINSLDRDSDNDGIPDVVEAGGVDENGDGIIDNFTDPDHDGLSQNVDASSNGAANSGVGLGLPDLDGDGIPNMFDLDSDNDGIYDVIEAGGVDANNDGRIDVPGFLLRTGPDTNNDGRADSYPFHNMDRDSRPNPYDLDSDGDGITDLREAGYPDEDWNGMLDPGTPRQFVYPNTDNTGPLDYLDIDSDDDGITDNIEGLATVNYQLPSGVDADKDGIDDAYDGFAGFGGNGISPHDEDMDGIPDYMDTDTDGDGNPDIIEGNDFNFNARADDLIELTGLDDDGDGLDNRFDADNTSAKVTSAFMGNGGSLNGDPNPGSTTVVQRNSNATSERDWRVFLYLLSTRFKKVTAYEQSNTIHLSWEVSSNGEISHYEVLRRDASGKYIVVATVQSPAYQDTKSGSQTDLQYRIRAVTRTGKQVLSDVVTVKLSIVEQLTVMPNPTQSYLQVVINARDRQWLDCQLMDERGRILYQQSQQLHRGNNTVQLTGLGKYPRGMYLLRLVTNNQEVITHKVILR